MPSDVHSKWQFFAVRVEYHVHSDIRYSLVWLALVSSPNSRCLHSQARSVDKRGTSGKHHWRLGTRQIHTEFLSFEARVRV